MKGHAGNNIMAMMTLVGIVKTISMTQPHKMTASIKLENFVYKLLGYMKAPCRKIMAHNGYFRHA